MNIRATNLKAESTLSTLRQVWAHFPSPEHPVGDVSALSRAGHIYPVEEQPGARHEIKTRSV